MSRQVVYSSRPQQPWRRPPAPQAVTATTAAGPFTSNTQWNRGSLRVCLCPDSSGSFMTSCPNGHDATTLASLVLAGVKCLLFTLDENGSEVPLRPDFFSDEVLLEAWLKKALGEEAPK